MSLFYNILYNGNVNFILRNFLKFINNLFGFNFILHPSGKLKVNLKNKKIVYFKTNQTAYVTVRVFWEGYEKFEYSSIFIDLIKKIKTFMDVGSNIGYYTIIGGAINKNLKIIAFEPSDAAFKYVKKNIIINNLSENVTLEKTALSDKVGNIEFYEVFNPKYPSTPNLSGEHNIGTKKLTSKTINKVKSTSLDKYIIDNKINNLDLIKLDTEGSEHLIMKSGLNTLEKFKPIIICEILSKAINRSFIDSILNNLKYNIYYHHNNKLNRISSVQDKIIKGVNDYFFVHPVKEYLIKDYL